MASTTIIPAIYIKNPLLTMGISSWNFGGGGGKSRSPMISCCTIDEKPTAGAPMFTLTSSNKWDVDYLGESTKGDLNVNFDYLEGFVNDNGSALKGPIEEVAKMEAEEAEDLLTQLGILAPFSAMNSPRGIFCSRTLNLRSISAIGYDMDYTLMHYNVMAWEGRAYDYCMQNLKKMGFPVDGLAFDPQLVIRGLVIDKEKGNLVKADRFGYVKRAMHGTRMLTTRAVRYDVNTAVLIASIS